MIRMREVLGITPPKGWTVILVTKPLAALIVALRSGQVDADDVYEVLHRSTERRQIVCSGSPSSAR